MKSQNGKRIAICTGGGDAPGLNAVIRAVVLSALNREWECFGVRDGYTGLLHPECYPDSGIVSLDRETVWGITHLGGTIIGASNRGGLLTRHIRADDGQLVRQDRTGELLDAFAANQLDALVAIGGDSSMGIAHRLAQRGLQVIGVPKTIDNDLEGTVITFGFDTAVSFATECLDRLHATAEAHRRIMVVEVMGRNAGWLALNAGVSGAADVILIPEIPFDIRKVAAAITARREAGQPFAIVIVAEGAHPAGDFPSMISDKTGGRERLGGIGEKVAHDLAQLTGQESRSVVLGHLLRGGTPTTFDRLISLRFGAAAVRALEEGVSGHMVALDPPTVRYVPLEEATRRMKRVPLDSDTILTARDLGISFGD